MKRYFAQCIAAGVVIGVVFALIGRGNMAIAAGLGAAAGAVFAVMTRDDGRAA